MYFLRCLGRHFGGNSGAWWRKYRDVELDYLRYSDVVRGCNRWFGQHRYLYSFGLRYRDVDREYRQHRYLYSHDLRHRNVDRE